MLAVTPNVACYRDVYGGIATLQYESRDALAEHGIRDVVERLVECDARTARSASCR
jgi:hypothetical protein